MNTLYFIGVLWLKPLNVQFFYHYLCESGGTVHLLVDTWVVPFMCAQWSDQWRNGGHVAVYDSIDH